VEIIVTFLALLELIKMRVVGAVQDQYLGSIVLELQVEDVDDVSFDLMDEYDSGAVVAEKEEEETDAVAS
jgi:chromatin segregation and condensation protein Rec8/ScpA/Scc1 (kleisin family)